MNKYIYIVCITALMLLVIGCKTSQQYYATLDCAILFSHDNESPDVLIVSMLRESIKPFGFIEYDMNKDDATGNKRNKDATGDYAFIKYGNTKPEEKYIKLSGAIGDDLHLLFSVKMEKIYFLRQSGTNETEYIKILLQEIEQRLNDKLNSDGQDNILKWKKRIREVPSRMLGA